MNNSMFKENTARHYDGNIHLMVYENDPQVPFHWHDENEFIYITEGKCICKVDSSTYILRAGECIFIRGGHLHSIFQFKTIEFNYFAVVFHPFLIYGTDCQKYFIEQFHFKPVYRHDVDGERDIIDKLKDIYNVFLNKPFAYEIKLKYLLLSIYNDIFEKKYYEIQLTPENRTKKVEMTEVAFKFIQLNYMNDISINDMAKELNYSTSYLTKLFRQYSGQSPTEYLIDYRIYKARENLESSDMTVLDVAYSVGFNHVGYFIKTFKKRTGFTPLQYRKNTQLKKDSSCVTLIQKGIFQ